MAGFATHYGVISNIVAKGRALLDGLRMAQQMGLRDFIVELDSTVIVGWIQSGSCTLLYLWDFGKKLKCYLVP